MVSDVCQAELKKLASHTWSSLGAWVTIIFVFLVLLITSTVIVGKDYSHGCKDFKTPKCGENDEYRNRMWSNSSFTGLLISSVVFLLLFGILLYFYSSSGKSDVIVDTPDVSP